MKKPAFRVLILLVVNLLACRLLTGAPEPTPLPPQLQTATAIWATPGCSLRNMSGSASWLDRGGETLTGIIHLDNGSPDSCRLHGRLQAVIRDSGGQQLPARQPELAGENDQAFVLEPRQIAIAYLTWSNYCGPDPLGAITLTLTLPGYDGFIDLPLEDPTGLPQDRVPACQNPDEFSQISVEPLTTR